MGKKKYKDYDPVAKKRRKRQQKIKNMRYWWRKNAWLVFGWLCFIVAIMFLGLTLLMFV